MTVDDFTNSAYLLSSADKPRKLILDDVGGLDCIWFLADLVHLEELSLGHSLFQPSLIETIKPLAYLEDLEVLNLTRVPLSRYQPSLEPCESERS